MRVQIPPPEQTKRLKDMALFIGIDPGVNTGFAVWNSVTRSFQDLSTLPIDAALDRVRGIMGNHGDLGGIKMLYFEDARLRKYLPRERNMSEYRGKLMGAGSVKRDCEIWEDFCKHWGIPYTAVPPRKGLTKWDAETFNKMTGWTGRTSNHARDAALLVWGK